MSLRLHSLALCLGVAAIAARAQAPFVISDFEDKTSANKISAYSSWAFITDVDSHGNSEVTSGDTSSNPANIDSTSFASPGNGTSQSCLKIAYKYGSMRPHGDAPDTSSYDPELGLTTLVYDSAGGQGADMSGATKLTFYAKADKPTKVSFRVATPEVTDYAFWGEDISISTAWKMYTVDFSSKDFAQPDWRTVAVPFNQKAIQAFTFVISQGNNTGATGGIMYLDDFTIYGWAPAVLPVSLRAAPHAIASAFKGAALAENGKLRVGLPSAWRASAGVVKVFALSGREAGRTAFAAGSASAEVSVGASDRGVLVYRVEPVGAK